LRRYQRLVILNALIDLFLMIEIISQRRMDFGQSHAIFSANFVDALAHPLMPDNDVLHREAVTGNPGSAPATPAVISIS
jgi:hypothetical protein